jgi:hypothetical protein
MFIIVFSLPDNAQSVDLSLCLPRVTTLTTTTITTTNNEMQCNASSSSSSFRRSLFCPAGLFSLASPMHTPPP